MRDRAFDATVGRNVAIARKAAGWTQARLAKFLGLDRSQAHHIEYGTRSLHISELRRLSIEFDLPAEWFWTPVTRLLPEYSEAFLAWLDTDK